ncbi:dirigent protein 11-like [Papaver somniferum]|uniref:dirigent protein 11-like n=1 Tax=Papaver somniferum TaxID=3469 RepID=UPI000E6F9B71|nr:dirigent protein 11-like [Papaver somniferum]
MGVMEYFSFLVVMVLSVTHHSQAWCGETVPYRMDMEKMTKLHFYFHDNITGDYPTSFKIAEAPVISNSSSTLFGSKKFNGSTINVFTRNPIADANREFVIIGGTGYFQFARGFVTAKTYSSTIKNAIVEYNCTIVHY